MQSSDYLIFVRHASTEWNEAGRLNGTTDLPLSSNGLNEAQHLALQLAECEN
jgi:probable phosphoglycerate mutase